MNTLKFGTEMTMNENDLLWVRVSYILASKWFITGTEWRNRVGKNKRNSNKEDHLHCRIFAAGREIFIIGSFLMVLNV